jgi:hypothetical protein
VLEQDDRIGAHSRLHLLGERALKVERLAVRGQSGKIEEVGVAHSGSWSRLTALRMLDHQAASNPVWETGPI